MQVFISHTKKDKEFCDVFDSACARVGIKSFRSEFETITRPAWKTIKDNMNNSVALFFLVGKELHTNQDSGGPEWRHTQNWIAYEIGLACQRGIDVWAICDDVSINFPMPYINNYLTVSLKDESAFDYVRTVLERYRKGQTIPSPYVNTSGFNLGIKCPHENCGMEFNLHVKLPPGELIRCPQCLKDIPPPQGHLRVAAFLEQLANSNPVVKKSILPLFLQGRGPSI